MSLSRRLLDRVLQSSRSTFRRKSPAARPSFRPTMEGLEERWVLSTLTVTSAADSGAGSLRAAVASAHNGDTINFASGLNGKTITLTSGELLLRKNLTISGPGPGQLTISGNKTSRIFELSSSGKPHVTLSGLTFSNGVAPAAPAGGGAIENWGTLTVSNCTVTSSSAYMGGGIDNQTGATLTVNTNSTLSGNSASYGGGVNNYGTLTISGGIISGNSASEGGGIWNDGTLTIAGSTLSGNGNSTYGGAIWNNAAATVSNCTFSGNLGIFGAAIESRAGSLNVSGSTFTNNSASYEGGALFLSGGTVTLTNDTMNANTAASYGGGIFISSAAAVSIDVFTVANTSNNTDSSGLNGPTANIDGSYTQR